MIHTSAWLGWLVSALMALSMTRNPLYLALILLSIALVVVSLRSQDLPPVPFSPLRFALIVTLLSSLFNAAISHFGQTILFHLPENIPLLGGPITLEALVFGAINGLVLSGIFGAFTVLNRALPVRMLIRLIPRAFYPVAIVTSISVTFVPVTLRHFKQIKEAQAIRGHRVRGVRDWLPLLMPLLVGGLERALQLAEAMTARGFASESKTSRGVHRLSMLVGLMTLLTGWLLRLVDKWAVLGGILMVSGAALVLGMLWVLGRQVPRTNYLRQAWTLRDWMVVLGTTIVLAAFLLPLQGLDRSTLPYEPYPALSLPGFDPLIGVAILGLIVPVFATTRRGL